MMTKKSDLLEKASQLNLSVSAKNTIAEIEQAINNASNQGTINLAKAGKRSKKAIDEANQIANKARNKALLNEVGPTTVDKKGPSPIARPKINRRSKKYQALYQLIDKNKSYSLNEAISLAIRTSVTNFDSSVEIHVRLNVDPRQADQNIRATVNLPHGSGKSYKVAVFTPDADHQLLKQAGADVVGNEEITKLLDKEKIDFDVIITSPQFMPKLSKYARLLGPRGLMPNPKSGTVATDLVKATKEAKSGKVEFRVDKQSIVHIGIGKVSFGSEKLLENAKAFIESLQSQKPSSLKSAFVKSVSVSTTMGPGIKVTDIN